MEDGGFGWNVGGSGLVVGGEDIELDGGGLELGEGLYGGLFYLVCNGGYGKWVLGVGKGDEGVWMGWEGGGLMG